MSRSRNHALQTKNVPGIHSGKLLSGASHMDSPCLLQAGLKASANLTCSAHYPKYRRVLAILVLFFSSLSVQLNAQDSLLLKTITIPDTTLTVAEFIQTIEKMTSLSFSYNADIINRRQKITVAFSDVPLIDVLKNTFKNPALEYRIVGRHLVIYQSLTALSVNPERKDSVNFYEISGRIFDNLTKQELPFANIYLRGKSIGTIANDEGEFLLKLGPENIKDTLMISHMGYKNYTAPVSELVNADLKFYLDMDVISIQEVIIRKQNPFTILASARENIRVNYPTEPAILTSFYRETVRKGNRYMMISEALLETYKPGYDDNMQTERIKVIKGRKKQDLNPDDTVVMKMKAGLNTMILLDIINYMPDFITNIADYDYMMADIVVDKGRENYAIDFKPKEYLEDAYYSGRIYVDVRDLSITGVDFSIEPEKLDDAEHLFILKKPASLRVQLLNAGYKVTFRKIEEKYYLHYISSMTGFRVRFRNQLFGTTYQTAVEMAVTQIDTSNIDRFRSRETVNTGAIFNDQLTSYNEDFWGEYNFIRPDNPLERAVEKLDNATLELLEDVMEE